MVRAVSRQTLGAWLLKANPAVWDVRRFRAEGHTRLTSWSVRRGYRADLMRPDDKVVFWLSGPGRGDLVRGVWGLGHVVSEAEEWQDTEPGWWRDEAARQALQARIEVDVPLLGHPLPASELRAADITDLEVQRVPQMSNPSWVSRTQLDRLTDLLPAWPLPPAVPLEVRP